MPRKAAKFHLFMCLPFELRRMIWKFCLPGPRIVELDYPVRPKKPSCEFRRSTRFSSLPTIAFVCRESREIALREYIFSEQDPSIPHADFPARPRIRFRPAFDTLHLNWVEGDMDSYNSRAPDDLKNYIRCLIEKAKGDSATKTVPPLSITACHVGQDQGLTLDGVYPIECLDLLDRLADWPVLVCVEKVTFHLGDLEAFASGLFGKLAKEQIKCVDLSDIDTIRKYHWFWLRYGYNRDRQAAEFFSLFMNKRHQLPALAANWIETMKMQWVINIWLHARTKGCPDLPRKNEAFIPPHPGRVDADRQFVKYTLNTEHPWVQECLRKMPRFRPTILFRHCAPTCWVTGWFEWLRKRELFY
ncbi:hypothetical protein PHISCL_04161 [Aspergillus sclerotialis]|uniref:2EXR domain-containing protein n=1 Tax=Aspergillus sclerotialis TaxID=2070753 RepID=A0A3A2ZK17_9EURO|nr:hypothetical protein PHISCL_04161 [Aspergillus sclerotialis]